MQKIKNPCLGEPAYLCFYWYNYRTQYTKGAIIDNVEVRSSSKPSVHVASVDSITSSSARLTMTGNVDKYIIEYKTDSDSVWNKTECEQNICRLTSLKENSYYEVRLYGYYAPDDTTFYNQSYFLTPAVLPYYTDFDNEESDTWNICNANADNIWKTDTADNTDSKSLYVTNTDNNDRNISVIHVTGNDEVVIAQKKIELGYSDIVDISFDVKMRGSTAAPYQKSPFATCLKVFLTSEDATFTYGKQTLPTNDSSNYSSINNSKDVFKFDGNNYIIFSDDSTHKVSSSAENRFKEQTAVLTFMFRCDWVNNTDNKGALIDNLSVRERCIDPVVSITNITDTSAEVNWNAEAENYVIRIGKTTDSLTYIYNDTVIIGGDNQDNYEQIQTDTLQTLFGCDSIVTTHTYYKYESSLTDIDANVPTVIYPNPAKDKIYIEAYGTVTVINNKGQAVKVIKDVKGLTEINIEDLEAGIYFIRNGNKTRKLIIE